MGRPLSGPLRCGRELPDLLELAKATLGALGIASTTIGKTGVTDHGRPA